MFASFVGSPKTSIAGTVHYMQKHNNNDNKTDIYNTNNDGRADSEVVLIN